MNSLYVKLSHLLSEQVNAGLIQPGEKLPSIRTLMHEHKVSKNTVINALNDLEAKGIVEAKNKVGFFVKSTMRFQDRTPFQHFPKLSSSSISLPDMFHHVMAKGAAFDILPSDKKQPPKNALINLNKHIRRAFREDVQYRASHYDSPKGDLLLREQISSRYRQRHLNINSEDLCITSGCQHGLMMALMAVCQQGDSVVVESPAFYGVLSLLEQLKLNVIEVSCNPVTGIDLEQYEQALKKWRVKACVITPNFATPTGSLMPESARADFIELSNQYDLAVIEDDIYGELSFTKPMSTLKALDKSNRVILVSSVSKSLSRDLRIGWIVGARWQKHIEQLKLTSQLAASCSIQQGLAAFIQKGEYRKHLSLYNQQLEQQKNHLISLLLNDWPSTTRFTNPAGGISLWVELDPAFDSQQLFHQLYQQRIVITPGMLFSYKKEYNHCLRISYQHDIDDKRREMLKYIGSLIT